MWSACGTTVAVDINAHSFNRSESGQLHGNRPEPSSDIECPPAANISLEIDLPGAIDDLTAHIALRPRGQKGCVVTLIGDPPAVLHQGNVQSVVSPPDLLVRASVMLPAHGTLGLSMLGG
jgi:hypothetical protein